MSTPDGLRVASLPAFRGDGTPAHADWTLGFRQFPDDEKGLNAETRRPPIVLLHGSPGSAGDFDVLVPKLQAAGYRVLVPDLLGYWGRSPDPQWRVPQSRSILAYAHSLIAWLDEMKIDRAHIVGWSNGGGIALHMADIAPQRIASLTLMASIGLPEYEWSGSHAFEHFKYGVAKLGLGYALELVPHFGLLGTFSSRTAWIDFFNDSDERPLRQVMERISYRGTPTLILHGRHDILVPDAAAEAHFNLIKSSRLVMLDANHFIPFLQADEAASVLVEWFGRFDGAPPPAPSGGGTGKGWSPGDAPAPWRESIDRFPVARLLERPWLDRQLIRAKSALLRVDWWAEILAIALGMLLLPGLTIALCALLIVHSFLDPAIVITGVCAGLLGQSLTLGLIARGLGQRAASIPLIGDWLPSASSHDWERRLRTRPFREGFRSQFTGRWRVSSAMGVGLACRAPELPLWRVGVFALARTLGVLVWIVPALIMACTVEATLLRGWRESLGWIGAPLTIAILWLLANALPLLFTRASRQHARATLARILHHEYWPTQVFYAPFYPWLFWQALRRGGLRQVTCCNPEIENGGGWAGESKIDIMNKLAPAGSVILPTFLVPADPSADRRIEALKQIMSRHPAVSTLPIVIKPNVAQRGHAFKLLRSIDQAADYFREMTGDAIVQAYHPGPQECGIFWMRHSETQRRNGIDALGHAIPKDRLGFIFSITQKEFPEVVGDGRRTLEELVRAHPRYRNQAHVFLDRFAEDASSVPSQGQRVRLAVSGNHCQGTLFRDGADLITDDLSAEVDRIARVFPRLDYGRFDVRYASDEDLRHGRGLAIIELNGTSSEPTNMYDPDRSPLFAYRTLFAMWRQVFELARERRAEGVPSLTVASFLSMVRKHARELSGSAIAD